MSPKIGIIIGIIVSIVTIGISLLYLQSNDLESAENNTSIIPKGTQIVQFDKHLFKMSGVEGENYVINEQGQRLWSSAKFALKPEHKELYDQIGILNEPQNTVVIFPIFTSSAYEDGGFYDYYKGKCDSGCLTTSIIKTLRGEASGNGAQILELLGYQLITDVDVDKNPNILGNYDKVILLHNEYVTRKEFYALTNHPNVIYLYPNALHAEITVNYDENTITLVRGHGYPTSAIQNGFDWEFDNSQYEYDRNCSDLKFYQIRNGWMLNCYPEIEIVQNSDLLKQIKDF
ncbi:MAG: hypothetical protein ACREAF_01555 [Nitrosopumilaceae archaeon]